MTSSPASTRPGLAVTLALYALARLGLIAVIAVALVLVGVPVLIAVLVGLIVALPLSMVLFRGLRVRLDEALAVTQERRSAERAALRARLRGDEPGEPIDAGEPVEPVAKVKPAEPPHAGSGTTGAPSDEPPPGQPDGGEHRPDQQ